ncbi:hypothetical protein SUGI_0003690 [Cryptomeria japonica]|nr:hypothetical protein SUGI_0003690 [Cryptomeria japonica]
MAKGGRSQTQLGVEETGVSAAAQNQHHFDAQVDGLHQGFGLQTHSRPISKNDRWEGGCVGRELIQRVSRLPSGGVSHGKGKPALVATALVPMTKSTSIFLSEEVEKEVEHNEDVFSELGLIYPHARGFFVVVFQSVADKNKVLGGGHWSWEDKHMLMLKLWHPAFNLESESFDRTPLWIRLPNLPMQYWFDACFEVVGNSLGTFLMADEDSLNLLHTTSAHLLVVVDVAKGLPSEISITSSKGSWLQTVDYEGIPFKCMRCFKMGHTVDSCTRLRVKHLAS